MPLLQVSTELPLGATVPALGLSNKAIFTGSIKIYHCIFLLFISKVDESTDATKESLSVKNSFSSEIPVFAPIDMSGIFQLL